MAIKTQESFVRATVTGAATAQGIVRAFSAVPADAIINDLDIEYDYSEDVPFPMSFSAKVEWVSQVDISGKGGAGS
jgi:hypothetical protein